MKAKPSKGKPGGPDPTPGAAAEELPERWSVQRKTELVMRLLRGEALDAVSRENQVPAHELERWQRIFLEQGKRGLRTKAGPEERELILARAKIGELMMPRARAALASMKLIRVERWRSASLRGSHPV